jgi:type IV pilus assembly protein PilW
MSCANLKNSNQAKGFSLVEIMVGMTLGLFTVIIIMQVISVFENQKRTTTAGSDAQENGLMAIVQLEQDIRSAGAGLIDSAVFACNTIYSQYNGVVPAPGVPATAGAPMAPVVITDGGTTGSDTISLTRGTDFLGSIPVTLTDTMPQPSSELNVSRTLGFVDGKLILVLQDNHCTVMQVSQVQGSALKVQHNPGGSYPYNPEGSFYNASPGDTWPLYTTGAKILSFGSFLVNTYSINANYSLQLVSDVSGAASSTAVLVKDIVSLQAQYGVSAVGVQNVSNWVDATGEWAFNALDLAHVKRIKAVRVTVVARSGKKEAGNVTTSAPGGVNISTLPGWQRYRYRVYTTIIPLRNIIWANL